MTEWLLVCQLREEGVIKLSHLIFADGTTYFFANQTCLVWSQIHGILKVYERVSRQKLSMEKMSIFFSKKRKTQEGRWKSIYYLYHGCSQQIAIKSIWDYRRLLGNQKIVPSKVSRKWFDSGLMVGRKFFFDTSRG